MSKTTTTTKTSSPYYNGAVSINGNNKATSKLDGSTVYSNYNMSDIEKAIYDYAQSELLNNLPNVNTFSDTAAKNMQSQVDAYTQKGQDLINNTYAPIINNLKNDIASRFGNFDNSAFLNNLNSIESKRSEAESSLAQDVLSKESDLVNNELSNRYNYLDLMNNIQNQENNNILSYLMAALSNSNSGSKYSGNTTTTNNNGNSYANLASSLMSNGSIYSKLASYFLSK